MCLFNNAPLSKKRQVIVHSVNTSEILHLVFVAEADDLPVMDAVKISDTGMLCSHSDDDDDRLRKVFESEGQTAVKMKSVLGVGVPPPPMEVPVFNPWKIEEILWQNGAFGNKIALCFDY